MAQKVAGISERLSVQITAFVQELRKADLYKHAGVSETLDWAEALVALDRGVIDAESVDETLGLLLKNQEDIEAVRGAQVRALLAKALTGSTVGA